MRIPHEDLPPGAFLEPDYGKIVLACFAKSRSLEFDPKDPEFLLVRRGEYLGLPLVEVRTHVKIVPLGSDLLRACAAIPFLDIFAVKKVMQFDWEWRGSPAIAYVFHFCRGQITHTFLHRKAEIYDVRDETNHLFDDTVPMLRKALCIPDHELVSLQHANEAMAAAS